MIWDIRLKIDKYLRFPPNVSLHDPVLQRRIVPLTRQYDAETLVVLLFVIQGLSRPHPLALGASNCQLSALVHFQVVSEPALALVLHPSANSNSGLQLLHQTQPCKNGTHSTSRVWQSAVSLCCDFLTDFSTIPCFQIPACLPVVRVSLTTLVAGLDLLSPHQLCCLRS